MKTLYSASNLKSIHHFSGLRFIVEVDFCRSPKTVVSCDLLIIRECSSTLYVGLARTVPPNNRNLRLIVLLIRLHEALYEGVMNCFFTFSYVIYTYDQAGSYACSYISNINECLRYILCYAYFVFT